MKSTPSLQSIELGQCLRQWRPLSSWAAIDGGVSDDIDGVIYDSTSLFPPQDIGSLSWHDLVNEEVLSKTLMRRFLFLGFKVAAPREEVGNGPCLDRPTRVEAVAALIWVAVMAATGEECGAVIAMDLRRRMDALPWIH
ncbi:hypothetical protein GH714_023812 [Hevea brasiliensis]|uniref:Uncharacterized protein n=1 Tax=Hevea brasiliensis TaxID=3981 RepID=A0A6A6MPE4_HEVBR|nr:hypothetical protein GH714_023812 [Hevea brasiliensis]